MLIKYFLLLKKKKSYGKKYTSTILTLTLALKKKKVFQFTLLSQSGFLLTSSGTASASEPSPQRSSEAGGEEDCRTQRALEAATAPSLLATALSRSSDATKANPDWSGQG